MNATWQTPQLNLIAAWVGILLGFASGMVLGLFFQRENWLGGYTSMKRRLYRLAHISFFGLGAVNLLFYFTAQHLSSTNVATELASWAFVVGAILMPICCLLMAHFPRTQPLFALPVLSLLLGGILTVATLVGALPSSAVKEPPRVSTIAANRPFTFHDSHITDHTSRITNSSL
jgi:hypothetical protein